MGDLEEDEELETGGNWEEPADIDTMELTEGGAREAMKVGGARWKPRAQPE